MTRFQLLVTLTQLLIFYCFPLFFSREIFPFSAYFFLHVHTALKLLLIKFNTRTQGKNIPLELQRCRFENFGVLSTILTKICYVKFYFNYWPKNKLHRNLFDRVKFEKKAVTAANSVLNYKKCRNQHCRSSSVKYTEMLTKTTDSSNFMLQICQLGVKTRRTSS